MAATQCRICFLIASGVMKMIVRPDADTQLNDQAFSPPDCVCANIPLATYNALTQQSQIYSALSPAITQANVAVGTLVAAVGQALAALGS